MLGVLEYSNNIGLHGIGMHDVGVYVGSFRPRADAGAGPPT